jgi:hypothetical protein
MAAFASFCSDQPVNESVKHHGRTHRSFTQPPAMGRKVPQAQV